MRLLIKTPPNVLVDAAQSVADAPRAFESGEAVCVFLEQPVSPKIIDPLAERR
jgi:hypothetical protein